MSNQSGPLLSLQNVSVRYKKSRSLFKTDYYHALRDVSFDINRGDSVGVLGRNGSGKSTLLRVLAGIIDADGGQVVKGDISCALLALQVGFDPQLNGYVNAVLSGMLLGLPREKIQHRMEQIIEFSELGDAIYDPIKVYSAGMRARLGFSIAVNLDPDVLLIDEVLGVGDAEFRAKSNAALRQRILSDHTVVLVSHQPATVKQLCNRAVWIENGVTYMQGPVDEVVNAYESYMAHAGKRD